MNKYIQQQLSQKSLKANYTSKGVENEQKCIERENILLSISPYFSLTLSCKALSEDPFYGFNPNPFSDSFRLDLLKVKNLKHETPHIAFSIYGIRKAMKGLLNSCGGWISESTVVLVRVLNLFRIYYKPVQIMGPQISPAKLVHKKPTMPLL